MGHPGVTFELEVRFAGAAAVAAMAKRELQAWLARHGVTAVVDGFVDGVDTQAGDEAPAGWLGAGSDSTPLLIYGAADELKALSGELQTAFGAHVSLRLGELADVAWQQSWQQQYDGLSTRHFVVTPPGGAATAEQGKQSLIMVGGGAFGGGEHATTEAMLLALEDLADEGVFKGQTTCLDLGTGTGVLAIAAAKLGAGSVVGTDLDAAIIGEAAANAAANHVALDLRVTDAVPSGHYQLIVANILVPVLHQLAPAIVKALMPGGRLLLAGFIDKDVPALTATYAAHGLTVCARRDVRGWLALTFRVA